MFHYLATFHNAKRASGKSPKVPVSPPPEVRGGRAGGGEAGERLGVAHRKTQVDCCGENERDIQT
ncbi:hypothetical protein ACFL5M_04230 [Candidatus Neomarinimicrobiota bacterium]